MFTRDIGNQIKCKASALHITHKYTSLYMYLAFSPMLKETMYEIHCSLEILQESSKVKYGSLAIFQFLCLFLIFFQLEHSGKHRMKVYSDIFSQEIYNRQETPNSTQCDHVFLTNAGYYGHF